MELTIADKIAQATELKDQGNDLFRIGEYKKALRTYLTVFLYTRGLPGTK